ncbi:hypothetical protein GCM10022376_19740 [Yimella lutea]
MTHQARDSLGRYASTGASESSEVLAEPTATDSMNAANPEGFGGVDERVLADYQLTRRDDLSPDELSRLSDPSTQPSVVRLGVATSDTNGAAGWVDRDPSSTVRALSAAVRGVAPQDRASARVAHLLFGLRAARLV